jgi:hypothetical protein
VAFCCPMGDGTFGEKDSGTGETLPGSQVGQRPRV